MPDSLYQFIWIFLIYAFLGWCSEVAFAALEQGKFINRGFLNGPVCPIYGVGMIIVLTALWPLKNNIFLLFLGAAILTSLLEYVTGYILEKFFHEKWWDYSDMPFNLKGYICLKFSLMWGFAATFVVGAIHKFVYFIVEKTPFTLGLILMLVCCAIFVSDLVITLIELLKLPKKLNAILELEKVLNSVSVSIGENISDTTIVAKEKGNELKEKGSELLEEKKPQFDELKAEYEKKKAEYRQLISSNFVHKRIFNAFPNLKKGRYSAIFEKISNIRTRISERKKSER